VISQDEQGPGTAPTLPKRSRGVRSRRRLTATATPSPTPDLSGVETNATLRPIRQYLTSALTICLFIIAALATIFALYAGKEVALPLAFAIVLKLLFQPAVQVVSGRLRLPNVVGALAVIVCLVLAIGALALGVSGPASTWIQKLPQVIPTCIGRRGRFARSLLQTLKMSSCRVAVSVSVVAPMTRSFSCPARGRSGDAAAQNSSS
jgi:lysylphosphatidylglycerol synthetase-like protein (DUF2156 family)